MFSYPGKRLSLYFKSLLIAFLIWLVLVVEPFHILSPAQLHVVSAVAAVLLAPAVAELIAVMALIFAIMVVPKHQKPLSIIAEISSQFALCLDNILNVIPGNPFALGRLSHMLALAQALAILERPAEAEVLLLETVKLIEKENGPDSKGLISHLSALAPCQRSLGKFQESVATAERLQAIGEKYTDPGNVIEVTAGLSSLGAAYTSCGRQAEAEKVGERAIELLFKITKEQAPMGVDGLIAEVMNSLGIIYDYGGNLERSADLFQRALNLKLQVMPKGSPSISVSYSNVAYSLALRGRFDEALVNADKAVEILLAAGMKDSSLWTETSENIAEVYRGLGRFAEAEPRILEAVSYKEKQLAPNDPQLAQSYLAAGKLYRDMGASAKAAPYFKKALAIYETTLGTNHPMVVRALSEYAPFLRANNNVDELAAVEQRLRTIKEGAASAALLQSSGT